MPLSATRGLSLSGCPVSSLLLTPEALAQVGARGRLVVLESTVSWKMAGGAWVSMVLTSTPHRHRMPGRNRSIPTILAGRFDGGLVDVSAVDTGSAGGIDSAGPWRPCGVLSTQGRPHHPLSYPFRLLLRGLVAPTRHRLRPAPALSRSTPRGWGSTGRGLCVLHEGPTYPEYPQPSSSGSRPSCSTGQAPSQRLRVAEPPPAAGRVRSRGPGPPAPVS